MLNKLFRREEQPTHTSGRAIVPLISDTHGGHSGALMNPDTVLELEDQEGEIYEYKPEMTEIQKYLWNVYVIGLEGISALSRGDPLFGIHDGDNIEGDKHPSELVRPEKHAQLQIAVYNLRPFCSLPGMSYLRLVKGTGAHEFGFSSATMEILRTMRLLYPAIDMKAIMLGLLTINGVEIDYSHHGASAGRRKWLEGNEARYYLRDRMVRDISMRGRPADIYIRGHYHTPLIEHLRVDGFWSILLLMPSMKIGGEFAAQATRSVPSITNGLAALEIEGGKIRDVHEFYSSVDMRTKEEILV
jgi:hypothetical protein